MSEHLIYLPSLVPELGRVDCATLSWVCRVRANGLT